jgi:5-methylcytosine-specific restriction endonuclease McrA
MVLGEPKSNPSEGHPSEIHMSNTYGISGDVERQIRARDKTCVYCDVSMKQWPHKRDRSEATIEHFNNRGPFRKKYNLAICCRGCNSSKGTETLLTWFKKAYCKKKNIREETVARPVKRYIRCVLRA